MKKSAKQKAFTLIELLVGTSIVIFMSAVIFANYNSENKQLALHRSSSKMAQDIRSASEKAISAAQINGTFPAGGYGIYFNISTPNQYILFADSDGGKDYDSGEAIGSPIALEKGIIISALSPWTQIAITFFPPDPLVVIKNNITSSTSSSAIILLYGGNQQKSVDINSAGLVSVGENVAITCGSNDDCNDSNPCTEDLCVNPATVGSSCNHNPLTGGSCGVSRTCQNGICSECLSTFDCETRYGTACDYETCALNQKPAWTCSVGNCSFSCVDDPLCVTDQPNGASCTLGQQCASGICSFDGYCCSSACSGECQTCQGGNCQIRSADDNLFCTTCKRCNGLNTTCQNVTTGQEGKNCTAVCKQCSSGACVNITNAEDIVGSNQWTGACKYCLTGSPTTVTCAQETYGVSCSGGNVCSGSGSCQLKLADSLACRNPSPASPFNTCSPCGSNSSCLFCQSGWCRSSNLCGTQIYAPTVINTGATNITKSAARLNGQVTDAGNENPTVTVYWGLTDGGTNPGSWTYSSNIGQQGASFYKDVTGLLSNTQYRYRGFAQNSGGSSWAPSTALFTTAPPTETILPTSYSGGSKTTNPAYSYDGNVNTGSATLYGNNLNPSISYGTAWQSKSYLWSSATIYVTLERQSTTGGDQAAVEVYSGTTLKHTLMSLGGAAFAKQEISILLNASDWGGSGFPNISNLRVNIRDTKSAASDNKNIYIYEIRIVGNVSD